MESHQIEILGHYPTTLSGNQRVVIYASYCPEDIPYRFFLLTLPAGFVCISKVASSAGETWLGTGDYDRSRAIGEKICTANGIELPSLVLENPFVAAGKTLPLPSFLVDNIRVDQVTVRLWGNHAVYYRLHVEKDWQPVICKQRLPMNHHYDWCPVSDATEADMPAMKELIDEYESGIYKETREINSRLVALLQSLG